MPYNFFPDSFHTGVTAEALRAKIDRKSAISLQCGDFDPKFQVEGLAPTNHSCNGCLTTLPLTVFTQRNFVADFLQAKCDFSRKSAVLRYRDSLWGLRGNVRRSS